jgi:hypothetical protein
MQLDRAPRLVPLRSPHALLLLSRKIVLCGFLVAIVTCLLSILAGLSYPFTSFLFRPWDRFQDFYVVLRNTAGRDPYTISQIPPWLAFAGHHPREVSNYLPFTHLLFLPFTWIPRFLGLFLYDLVIFAFVVAGTLRIAFATGEVSRGERIRSAVAFSVLNYPVLFLLDRGNIEGVVFIFLALGAVYLLRERPIVAAVCLGLATAVKGFPVLFFVLFLKRRYWRGLAMGLATTATLTVVALLTFQGTPIENLFKFRSALREFSDFLYTGWFNSLCSSVSWLGALYSVFYFIIGKEVEPGALQHVHFVYSIVAGLFMLAGVVYVWRVRMPAWKEWFILIALSQVLPHPSFDYRLIHTLIPLGMLLVSGDTTRGAWRAVVLMSLILIPKSLFILFWEVRISTIINPMLISAGILLFIAEDRWSWASATVAA